MNGGDDGTRTRGLCRDRRQFTRWHKQNQQVSVAVVGTRWLHWAVLVIFCSTICSTLNAQTFRVPFHDAYNGLVLLDVKVDGKPAVLLLDTGTNVSLFGHHQTSIGIELEPKYFFNLPVYDLDKQIGQRAFQLRRDVGPFDGILGQNFLRHFQAMRIDYKNHVVELEE